MKSGKITIKDVAKDAGVGVGTVSRTLNGAAEVSVATRDKVLRSIAKLGYSPDQLAQSMRSNKYRKIAFLISDISNVAFAQIAKGIQDYVEPLGYSLYICSSGETAVAAKVRKFLEGKKLDGIILSVSREDDAELHELVRQSGVPVITLDRDIPDVAPGIVTDYYSSVRRAVQYLISLGHRGIVMAAGTRRIRPTRVSIEGFEAAFRDNGIPPSEDRLLSGTFTAEFGRHVVEKLLPDIRARRVTAIVTLNNRIFCGVLRAMRDHDLDYPRDVSLITVEDSELTELLKPAVTVIQRPLAETGAKAAEHLLRVIDGGPEGAELRPVHIPTQFIVRDSCGAVN